MFNFGRGRRSGGEVHHTGRVRFVANVEAIEGRTLLTATGATILLSNGVIEVLGTNLGDTGSVTLQGGRITSRSRTRGGATTSRFPPRR